jgi:hypothetical protein
MAMMAVTTTATTGSVPPSGLLVAVLATRPPGATLLLGGRLLPHLEVGPVVAILRDPEMTIPTTGSPDVLRPLRIVPGRPSSRR